MAHVFNPSSWEAEAEAEASIEQLFRCPPAGTGGR